MKTISDRLSTKIWGMDSAEKLNTLNEHELTSLGAVFTLHGVGGALFTSSVVVNQVIPNAELAMSLQSAEQSDVMTMILAGSSLAKAGLCIATATLSAELLNNARLAFRASKYKRSATE